MRMILGWHRELLSDLLNKAETEIHIERYV
jgi:hypothetical protein